MEVALKNRYYFYSKFPKMGVSSHLFFNYDVEPGVQTIVSIQTARHGFSVEVVKLLRCSSLI